MWRLKEDLERALPNSVCLYNLVLLCAQTEADTHTIYVPRDQTSSIVITKEHNRENLSIYCPLQESPILQRILHETSVVDFSRAVLVGNLTEELVPLVWEALETRGGRPPKKYIDWLIYYYPRDIALNIPKMTYEDGEVRQLGTAGLRCLYDTWSFKDLTSFNVVEALWRYTPFLGFYLKEDLQAKDIFTTHNVTASNTAAISSLPSENDLIPSSFSSSSGFSEVPTTTSVMPINTFLAPLGYPPAPEYAVPVAWVGFGRAGVAGQLMVEPAWHGRGLSSALVLAFLPAMASQGYEIGFHVEDSNNFSKAYVNHGAQPLFRDHWIYLPASKSRL